MDARVTTFGRLLVGQQFKVIWATDEQALLHPNTLYTKCTPAPAQGGYCNATARVGNQTVGVWIDESRAVLAWEPEPIIEMAAGLVAAA